MHKRSIFIAATGQNVGKTTLCLGIIAGLQKRFSSIGFIKPVGQQHIRIEEGLNVDKDVVLFKKHFNLAADWSDMSPVIIPSGFTRDYLDGNISGEGMLDKIESSFLKIASQNQYTVVEGTGHVGVGSIIDLNNAAVAAHLKTEVIIIASGGLGSAHDELALNIGLCRQYGVKIRGVILNRVIEDKRQMLLDYFPTSLKKWGVPLIGAIPYSEFLSQPTIQDFANLFKTHLLSGETHRFRHFQHSRLVADSVETYEGDMIPNELVITPASREDIILANIEKHRKAANSGISNFAGGMILTGHRHPTTNIIEKLRQLDLPMLYVNLCSFETMKKIASFTSKIRTEDELKVEHAITLVEENINFDLLTNGHALCPTLA
jgi:BioD-like phosphotransacetylase family protein